MRLVLHERSLDFSLELLGDRILIFFELLLDGIQLFLFGLEEIGQPFDFLAHYLVLALYLYLLPFVFKVELRDISLELLYPPS